MVKNESVLKLLGDELKSVSGTLKSFERPKHWMALDEAFSQDNQMLSAKMSIRRNNVLAVHAPLVDEMYAGAKEGHACVGTLTFDKADYKGGQICMTAINHDNILLFLHITYTQLTNIH